jgi:hypothetical protein
MNNNLDIDVFTNLRYNEECLYLDNEIIESIIDTYSNNKYKKTKYNQKKILPVIKNQKLKQIKDKISNKVNLILNKLSENNIDNLVIEFINNVKINNIDDYNEFIKSFYIKILSEINFFKFYIKFFLILTSVYEKVNNYSIEYFYNLIESKFNNDYFDNNENEDEKRINNLILIRELINVNFFTESFIEYIDDKILNQKKYLSDIYYWFKDIKLTDNNIEKINLLLDDNIQLRDKVLLDNLLNNKEIINNKIIFKKIPIENITNVNEDIITIELNNILDEYFFIDNSESIEYYINNNCKDANTKNKFSEYIIDKYFKLQYNDSQKILILIKKLIKLKILFKSNLSRALLNLYNSKYTFNQDKIKKLLIFLKNLGITNGLESLMTKYKIDITINL